MCTQSTQVYTAAEILIFSNDVILGTSLACINLGKDFQLKVPTVHTKIHI